MSRVRTWIRRVATRLTPPLLLRSAAVLTMVALALMVWSMLDPTPLPVMLAMSVGQAIGTLAFGLFGFVVLQDLRRIRRVRRESLKIPLRPSMEIPFIDPRPAPEAPKEPT